MGSIISFLFGFELEPDGSEVMVPLFPPSASISPVGKPNLEIFSLLWCDADVEKVYSSRATQEKLLDLISFQRTFTSIDECERFICQQTTTIDKIILICSGSFAHQLLSRVHEKAQLTSVYVYCFHTENYQQLNSQFGKVSDLKLRSSSDSVVLCQVRCVENNSYALVKRIADDHQVEHQLDEQNMPMTFYQTSERTHKNLARENGNFIWFQLFIETLLRLRTVDVTGSMEEFVQMCHEQYWNNDRQRTTIDNFRGDYDPEHCLWWYSREVFLYGILNKALRVGDMDTLYTFRFFIRDLHQQLTENQLRPSEPEQVLDLYRGQAIGDDELERMRACIGQYVSMNSFFSTSRQRSMGLHMAHSNISAHSHLQPILFHIKVNPQLSKVKPYADISDFSNYGNVEAEILFMLGSIFRLLRVYDHEEDRVTIAELELCSEDDNELSGVYEQMKKEVGEETDIKVLGNVLKDMGQYDRALQCYEKILKLVSPNDLSVRRCYYSIGQVKQLQGKYEESLSLLDQIIELEASDPSEDAMILGLTHNYMGIAYQYGTTRHDYVAALAHYERALQIHLEVKGRLYPATPYVYNNLATLHRALGNYEKSLEYHQTCLEIKRDLYPNPFDARIASSLNNIGVVYQYKQDYSMALKYYDEALQIRLKVLPENHQDQAACYINIAQVHELLDENLSALPHAEKALAIYRSNFNDSHPHVSMVNELIDKLKKKLPSWLLSNDLSRLAFFLYLREEGQERVFVCWLNRMRSLKHLLRRSIDDESVQNAYRWLFCRAQQLSRTKSRSLFGHFRSLIAQYHRDVPIEYLCGSAMFFRRLFLVNRHVLIPRRDSECLIEHVQQLYPENTAREWISVREKRANRFVFQNNPCWKSGREVDVCRSPSLVCFLSGRSTPVISVRRRCE